MNLCRLLTSARFLTSRMSFTWRNQYCRNIDVIKRKKNNIKIIRENTKFSCNLLRNTISYRTCNLQSTIYLQQLLGTYENKRLTRHRAYLNGNTRSNNDENDSNCRIGQMRPTRRLVAGRSIRGTAPPTWRPNHAADEYEVHWQRHDTGIEHVQKSVLLQQQQPQQQLLLSAFV